MSPSSRRFDATAAAVVLAHTAPHVTLLATTACGGQFRVSHHDPRATMTPCELRNTYAAPRHAGRPHARDAVVGLEVVSGLVDLGGGMFQRAHPSAPDERWFTVGLTHDDLIEIAHRCPRELGGESLDVVLKPDALMGACTVVMSGDDPAVLDATACWFLAACLAEELLRGALGTTSAALEA